MRRGRQTLRKAPQLPPPPPAATLLFCCAESMAFGRSVWDVKERMGMCGSLQQCMYGMEEKGEDWRWKSKPRNFMGRRAGGRAPESQGVGYIVGAQVGAASGCVGFRVSSQRCDAACACTCSCELKRHKFDGRRMAGGRRGGGKRRLSRNSGWRNDGFGNKGGRHASLGGGGLGPCHRQLPSIHTTPSPDDTHHGMPCVDERGQDHRARGRSYQ